jgi:dihydrofolate reductase
MRTLIVTEFITLDGVVDSAGDGSHPHAGWTFKDVDFDAAAYNIKEREQAEAEALMVGRVSYEQFAPQWPKMEEFSGYNAMPRYVVSTTLADTSPWPATVLGSIEEVAELKSGTGGPIIVHGSPTLAQGLAAAGLVDRYHLLVFPLLLGSGKRLFGQGEKTKLKLVESASYSNGVQLAVYEVPRGAGQDGE